MQKFYLSLLYVSKFLLISIILLTNTTATAIGPEIDPKDTKEILNSFRYFFKNDSNVERFTQPNAQIVNTSKNKKLFLKQMMFGRKTIHSYPEITKISQGQNKNFDANFIQNNTNLIKSSDFYKPINIFFSGIGANIGANTELEFINQSDQSMLSQIAANKNPGISEDYLNINCAQVDLCGQGIISPPENSSNDDSKRYHIINHTFTLGINNMRNNNQGLSSNTQINNLYKKFLANALDSNIKNIKTHLEKNATSLTQYKNILSNYVFLVNPLLPNISDQTIVDKVKMRINKIIIFFNSKHQNKKQELLQLVAELPEIHENVNNIAKIDKINITYPEALVQEQKLLNTIKKKLGELSGATLKDNIEEIDIKPSDMVNVYNALSDTCQAYITDHILIRINNYAMSISMLLKEIEDQQSTSESTTANNTVNNNTRETSDNKNNINASGTDTNSNQDGYHTPNQESDKKIEQDTTQQSTTDLRAKHAKEDEERKLLLAQLQAKREAEEKAAQKQVAKEKAAKEKAAQEQTQEAETRTKAAQDKAKEDEKKQLSEAIQKLTEKYTEAKTRTEAAQGETKDAQDKAKKAEQNLAQLQQQTQEAIQKLKKQAEEEIQKQKEAETRTKTAQGETKDAQDKAKKAEQNLAQLQQQAQEEIQKLKKQAEEEIQKQKEAETRTKAAQEESGKSQQHLAQLSEAIKKLTKEYNAAKTRTAAVQDEAEKSVQNLTQLKKQAQEAEKVLELIVNESKNKAQNDDEVKFLNEFKEKLKIEIEQLQNEIKGYNKALQDIENKKRNQEQMRSVKLLLQNNPNWNEENDNANFNNLAKLAYKNTEEQENANTSIIHKTAKLLLNPEISNEIKSDAYFRITRLNQDEDLILYNMHKLPEYSVQARILLLAMNNDLNSQSYNLASNSSIPHNLVPNKHENNNNIWINYYNTQEKQSKQKNTIEYSAKANGVILGGEIVRNKNLILGLGIGYCNKNVKFHAQHEGNTAKIDSILTTPYLYYKFDSKIFIEGNVSFNINLIKNDKILVDPTTTKNCNMLANYRRLSTTINSLIGYQHTIGEVAIIPKVGMKFSKVGSISYTEKNSDFNQNIKADSVDNIYASTSIDLIGKALSKGNFTITPKISGSYIIPLHKRNVSYSCTIPNLSPSIIDNNIIKDCPEYKISINLSNLYQQNCQFDIGYSLNMKGKNVSHNANCKIRFNL
ncbi:autotransporter outer membrane beta-barrel domain-containing protein [Rickettsia endosymbiont of Cardiosporidium cionae]|uniref:autotransporter outer membrane beta-barrel domain-containing protein n=1 Tax=Rickettsia endosymbiont of Cardiosporidium cionae TaxID=2777155 RepID=UPI00189442E3|nr:autotransporter outer membrane beta-barrel domain-containing protein [Rickettsia endosymbiont of Cardiosporidium cionae]KAF8818229.1 hypothetical protein IHI24_000686 [Rickettsia endosymbiont of Cardiosporidium cionae]